MLQVLRRISTTTVLCAAALVGVATTGQAQGGMPIASGHAAVAGLPDGITRTSFSMVQRPDGALQGNGITSNSLGGFVRFQLTSVLTIDGVVVMAGPITATFNAPPQFVVGGTYVLAVKDNSRDGSIPDEFANGTVPFPASVHDLITEPLPPQIFRPLLSGNLTVY